MEWNISRLIIASKIAQLNLDKNNFNISDLARHCEISPNNPSFKKLIKSLIDENILIEKYKIGSSIIITMNKDKFVNSVTNSEIWEAIETLVGIKNRFWGLYKI